MDRHCPITLEGPESWCQVCGKLVQKQWNFDPVPQVFLGEAATKQEVGPLVFRWHGIWLQVVFGEKSRHFIAIRLCCPIAGISVLRLVAVLRPSHITSTNRSARPSPSPLSPTSQSPSAQSVRVPLAWLIQFLRPHQPAAGAFPACSAL